jgi:hypothetical protein
MIETDGATTFDGTITIGASGDNNLKISSDGDTVYLPIQ